jgi:hypothetical protein
MANTAPKPFVFVLMPVDSGFKDVYELGIKPACIDAGAHPERVDEQIFQDSIIGRIYNNIAKADIIVADMTGRNPNVFYEVGYAHALNKLVVLLTKDAKDIPFDLQDYPHIVYSSISELKSALTARVQWFVNNPRKGAELSQTNLELYIRGTSLQNHPTITYFANRSNMSLDVHNPTSVTFPSGAVQIGLILKGVFRGASHFEKAITLPNEQGTLWMFPLLSTLFPQGWETMPFAVSLHDEATLDVIDDWVFKVFTGVICVDFPVSVKVQFN